MFASVAEVSLREATFSEKHEEWRNAILSEVESLVTNDTWQIIKKPDNQKGIGCVGWF